ncbi:acetyl-CoA carboxylase biotin carboxyl carrier protein subunit [Flavobacterium sp. NST-5]|uniref:Acetyl-CoA carboxylase biotin carboxyl carrier protein subunit n=1 Tax=Flavobacterium ichthyis TaxID=2698827 RepID=A0ABW9Z9E3_9FLAO|nr:acetyl-CoA carboxylase biotin carboxyl carrier protein subunit [Flavobacterium ichthyis]NBL64781.1 acetyl-CoA carboxylase biotin carboxyl carrier protein subunit [Flavobacterium ichthyis]
MKSNFNVIVNNREFTSIDLEQETIVLNDLGNNRFHVIKDYKNYSIQITKANYSSKSYTVEVNANQYEVALHSPLDQLIAQMGFTLGGKKEINSINAPMPGMILEIAVRVGQEVGLNEPLLILEAMKMENSFHSPRAGIIKSIAVKIGDAVEKGQLLIEFE